VSTITAPRELLALALTLLIEVPIYTALLHVVIGATRRSALIAAVVVNLISHPLAFLVIGRTLEQPIGTVATIVVVEIFVAWLGEAALLWCAYRRAFPELLGIAFVANATSLAIGLVIFR
jgi:hypothetical protein